MIIDLSAVEVFDSNEIDFDRKITFVYGKNGTGKSTLTEELKKLSSDYDVSAFQGFSNVIDENKRLNAVVLGEMNGAISRQIKDKKDEMQVKYSELEAIKKTLQKPEDDTISSFWTKKYKAEEEYKAVKKKIDNFYSQSASLIKNLDKPRVAQPSYNKRNFQDDISNAILLTEEEQKQYVATINSEVKNAPAIAFPKVDLQKLAIDTNNILQKTVIERVKINRLENNAEKREFAKNGLRIHKKGDICAFCGNKIGDDTWDELASYFSADEVKGLHNEIQNKIKEIDLIIAQIDKVCVDSNKFYPSFVSTVKDIGQEMEKQKKGMLSHLNKLKIALDDKLKYLFEPCPCVDESFLGDFEDIEKRYNELRQSNNENDIIGKQREAVDKLRRHHVKECLDKFGYDRELVELNTLDKSKKLRIDEFNIESKKITGPGGLNEVIKTIQDEIVALQNSTQNEVLLAEKINKKLKHMVSFELVHVEDEESKGFYRVKNSTTGCEREITELSTGEKNVIAFLYFIEKLDEVKDSSINKPRIIIFDDPMCSNDDGMQYLIIEELQNLMKKLLDTDHFILLTHNKHFYLNVKYGHKYKKDRFIRFQSDGNKTHFMVIDDENKDYKTSYESLWGELKFLYETNAVSADLLLNPIRRIIETFTKFNAIEKVPFCGIVDGAMKLFNVNSHSIDDIEAELNGKTKNEIIQMFYDCFSENKKSEHFKKYWGELEIGEDGRIIFAN